MLNKSDLCLRSSSGADHIIKEARVITGNRPLSKYRRFVGMMDREGVPVVGRAEAGVEERGERRRPVVDQRTRGGLEHWRGAWVVMMGLVEGERALKVEGHRRGGAVDRHWCRGGQVCRGSAATSEDLTRSCALLQTWGKSASHEDWHGTGAWVWGTQSGSVMCLRMAAAQCGALVGWG